MEIESDKKINYTLAYGIGFVVVVVFVFFYSFGSKENKNNKALPIALNSEKQTVINPIPQPIRKTEEVMRAEKTVKVSRDVKSNKDGSFTIVASMRGLSNIPEEVVMNDFHEEIRLGKHANIVSGNVSAVNGHLFPSDNKVSVSSYGPGPRDKRSTSIDITLLDLNFDQKTNNTGLYELNFALDVSVEEFTFAAAEVRSGKYILEFEEEKINL